MTHSWRKHEKQLYLPPARPVRIKVPPLSFYTIQGEGNPNSEAFGAYIKVLYSVSYAIRMSPKKGMAPDAYTPYTVYPLEGVWDLQEEARARYTGTLNKDDLAFTLMIRQPDFVNPDYADRMLDWTREHKPHPLLAQVRFAQIEEGECIQMLHLGPYDDEPASFAHMETFASEQGLHRTHKTHREIYLSDARKTPPEKLKTVLRFQVHVKDHTP